MSRIRRVFTIGYEGADPERFRTALLGAGVALLADVRAVALSRKRGFSKTALREGLESSGIGYLHLVALGTPKEGRAAARAGDAGTLRRIYCEALRTEAAGAALENLASLASAEPVCLMCFERDPEHCHRRIIGERLGERGFEVVDLSVV